MNFAGLQLGRAFPVAVDTGTLAPGQTEIPRWDIAMPSRP